MLIEQGGGEGKSRVAQIAKVGTDCHSVGALLSEVSAPEVYRSLRHIGLFALGEGEVGVGNVIRDVVVF